MSYFQNALANTKTNKLSTPKLSHRTMRQVERVTTYMSNTFCKDEHHNLGIGTKCTKKNDNSEVTTCAKINKNNYEVTKSRSHKTNIKLNTENSYRQSPNQERKTNRPKNESVNPVDSLEQMILNLDNINFLQSYYNNNSSKPVASLKNLNLTKQNTSNSDSRSNNNNSTKKKYF